MARTAMWAHGTALVVEDANSLYSVSHRGWGTELRVKPNKTTWFHAPIPTPVLVEGIERAKLVRVFILFNIGRNSGIISNVVIWDAEHAIWKSSNLRLEGNHLPIGRANTFNLPSPREVFTGINIAFAFSSATSIDGDDLPPAELHVAAFGADFET